jgi:hypothetical protein
MLCGFNMDPKSGDRHWIGLNAAALQGIRSDSLRRLGGRGLVGYASKGCGNEITSRCGSSERIYRRSMFVPKFRAASVLKRNRSNVEVLCCQFQQN